MLAGLLAGSGCAAWRIVRAVDLARHSEPLQQRPAASVGRLLVVGDSTAVGTGASAPAHSVAGRIAQAHPQLLIDNRARDGARHADLLEQMRDIPPGTPPYDMVLVQAGGNDVIRLRGHDALRADIEQVVLRASEIGRVVVLMPCGNVGNAPFFFPPLSWWMTQRSRVLHRLVAEAAARHGAVYVDLFQERVDDPFVKNPALNASDGLHPSDAGYALWWAELQAQARLPERLAAAH